MSLLLCLLLQRYTFWSNSQRCEFVVSSWFYCACYCKDTHFEAIHNYLLKVPKSLKIVLATAKIHILKQFTTKERQKVIKALLCLLLQRYTFWSNSQHKLSFVGRPVNCACYCKDTHFEAIHNKGVKMIISDHIVLATAKIHILKQFTTLSVADCCSFRLCLLLQRYTFWSNSQPMPHKCTIILDCACYCKDTHFEAIHNSSVCTAYKFCIVLATAKIHILKQFTTQ